MRTFQKNRIRRRILVGLLSLAVALSTVAMLTVPARTLIGDEEPEAQVTIRVKKNLDGQAPGVTGRCFSFQLLNDQGELLQTVQNDDDGNVVFAPISYTRPGTYTYSIKEVNDGQAGINYDTKTLTATVTVTSSILEIEGETLDGGYMRESATNSYFYMTDTATGKQYKAFCLNRWLKQPADQTFLASTDVSDATIQAALTSPSAENLAKVKKVLYYFSLYPDSYNDFFKQLIFWQATGTDLGTQQGVVIADELAKICDAITTIPSNFHTVFFDSGDSAYQCLLYGYISPEPQVVLSADGSMEDTVFENRTGYELPATGGIGTRVFTLAGLLLVLSAWVIYTGFTEDNSYNTNNTKGDKK